uniref:Transposase n=1 Tax=Loa loa TaxID=7209 RepID=A0A1I7VW78_LOALO
MFRHFIFICEDYTIFCNDGYLIFAYWRHIKLMDLHTRGKIETFKILSKFRNSSLKGRLCLTLNGLRIHIYNRLEAYRKLKKDPKFEKLFTTISQQQYTDEILHSNEGVVTSYHRYYCC